MSERYHKLNSTNYVQEPDKTVLLCFRISPFGYWNSSLVVNSMSWFIRLNINLGNWLLTFCNNFFHHCGFSVIFLVRFLKFTKLPATYLQICIELYGKYWSARFFECVMWEFFLYPYLTTPKHNFVNVLLMTMDQDIHVEISFGRTLTICTERELIFHVINNYIM